MTTTIYDTDDTAMLNSDPRLRDRNCVTATATVTATQLNCMSVFFVGFYTKGTPLSMNEAVQLVMFLGNVCFSWLTKLDHINMY